MKKTILILIALFQYGYADDTYYYQNNQKVTITPIVSILRSNSDIDYYQTNNNIVLGVTDKLIVKLENSDSLEQYLNEFNLTLEKTLDQNLYLLKVTNKNSTIDISNQLNEKDDILFSHPDFIKKMLGR